MNVFGPRPVRFGELAGRVLKSSTPFDWAAWGVQAMADSLEYPLKQIIDAGGIPYAPAGVSSRFTRYPRLGDAISLDVAPVDVGEHRIVLAYEFTVDNDTPVGTMEVAHVSIDSSGDPLPLPPAVIDAVRDRLVETGDRLEGVSPVDAATPGFDETVTFRTPHSEAVDLGYFAEYPKFATIALEEYLVTHGFRDGSLPPLRLRRVDWSFRSPIATGDSVTVTTEPVALDEDSLRLQHTFSTAETTAIDGQSELSTYSSSGVAVPIPEEVRNALRSVLFSDDYPAP